MAYNKNKKPAKSAKGGKGKKSSKNTYLDSGVMNKLSESLNDIIFSIIRQKCSIDEGKAKFLTLWEQAKTDMAASCTPKTIESADALIQGIADMDEQALFLKANPLIDAHRKQSDVSLGKARNDIMYFWLNAAYKKTKTWDIPWLRRMQKSEKFMPFYAEANRYVFKGHVNQMILGSALEHYRLDNARPGAQNIVLFMGDIQKILAEDFVADPQSPLGIEEQRKAAAREFMRGKKSLTSVFVRTSMTSYKNPDGSSWRGPKGEKTPPRQVLAAGEVTKREVASYVSHPVWLADSLIDSMSQKVKQKYQELVDERILERGSQDLYTIGAEEHDLQAVIDAIIAQHIRDMSIKVDVGGDRAAYYPARDVIQVPAPEDFTNPVERYATCAHELAHSTMHLCDRAAGGRTAYAQEEIVAETTAMLMTHELRERLTEARGGQLPQQWQAFFNDYYENSKSYSKHWGERFDFAGMLDQIFEINDLLKDKGKKADMFTQLMEQTLSAFGVLKSGKLNEQVITGQLRAQKAARAYDAAPAMGM